MAAYEGNPARPIEPANQPAAQADATTAKKKESEKKLICHRGHFIVSEWEASRLMFSKELWVMF